MIYIVDIDGTICHTENGNYESSVPYYDRINHFNDLFDKGNEIHYYTARGSASGTNRYDLTKTQLQEWGAKYTSFAVGKPVYDYWIDDKAINVDDYFKNA